MAMKLVIKMLLLALIVLLSANTVISDRVEFEYSPNNSDIIVHFGSPENSDAIDHVEMHLNLIVFLFVIGFIGLASLTRRRIGDKKNEKDITP